MTAENPPAQDLVDEMSKLQEGMGAAKEQLARVTQYLGNATRELTEPSCESAPAEQAPAAASTPPSEPGPK